MVDGIRRRARSSVRIAAAAACPALIWSAGQWRGASGDPCIAPDEPEERHVTINLVGGQPWVHELDRRFLALKRNSDHRPEAVHDLFLGGYSEFMEEYLGGWSNFVEEALDDGYKKQGKGIPTWKARLRQLARVVHAGFEEQALMDMYAGRELRPAVLGSHWLRKAEFNSLQLQSDQRVLLNFIFRIAGRKRLASVLQGCPGSNGFTVGCSCMVASCLPVGESSSEGKLVALELKSRSFQWPADTDNLPAAPSVLGLALAGQNSLKHPSLWLRWLPGLEVLKLAGLHPSRDGAWAELAVGFASSLLGFVLAFDSEEDVEVARLEPICRLQRLRRLKLDGRIRALPACLGALPLLELDVRGLHLRGEDAVPRALGALGATLVSFIAYSQGRDRRCPSQAPASKRGTPDFLTRCRPRPSWDAGDSEQDGHRSWQCPWESWAARLDDPDAPWWNWSRMERFWVDANFLHGGFPEELAKAWPAMRSLDLQLNEISGPLPSALANIQNLSALRVHRNRFEGEVPGEIFTSPSLSYTNFEGNAGLRGCLPENPFGTEKAEHALEVNVQGTGISGLCAESTSKHEL